MEHCHMYTHFMKGLFQKIPVGLSNQHSPKEKRKSLLHAIGGGWYVDKLGQKLPPPKNSKSSKKKKKRRIK